MTRLKIWAGLVGIYIVLVAMGAYTGLALEWHANLLLPQFLSPFVGFIRSFVSAYQLGANIQCFFLIGSWQ